MQDQTHHGNVESTSSCVQGSASGDRQGYRGPLGRVCGGSRDTSPTPRHEGLVQTPENDGGPGREENLGTAGHQGRERQSAARQGGHPPAVGEILRQSAQHQVSRTPTIHRREGTAAEEGTAAAARSTVANRGANITRGRANVCGDAAGSPGDGKLESAGR